MRLLLIGLLLLAVPALAQLGGDSRFYHVPKPNNDSVLVSLDRQDSTSAGLRYFGDASGHGNFFKAHGSISIATIGGANYPGVRPTSAAVDSMASKPLSTPVDSIAVQWVDVVFRFDDLVGQHYIVVTVLDTTGYYNLGSFSMALYSHGDTLSTAVKRPNNTEVLAHSGSVLKVNQVHSAQLLFDGSTVSIRLDGVLLASTVVINKVRKANRLRIGKLTDWSAPWGATSLSGCTIIAARWGRGRVPSLQEQADYATYVSHLPEPSQRRFSRY